MEQRRVIYKSLLWDVTRKCNLKCNHCYNSEHNSVIQDLDLKNNYKKIIDTVLKLGINHIHLLGGEPLLLAELYELMEYANLKGIYISINTNGTLLTVSMMRKLMELKVLQLTISLDGANKLDNDGIRGEGTFDLVVGNIKQAVEVMQQSQVDIDIQVATVITKQNMQSIHQMPRLLKGIGVKNLDVLKLYECGNAVKNETMLQISNEEYIEVLKKLLLESYRNGIFIQVDCKPKVLEVLGKKFGFNVRTKSEFNKCSAVKKILYMDCSGNVFPCGPIAYSFKEMNLEDDFKANIFQKDFLDCIAKFDEMIKKYLRLNNLKSDMCRQCSFAPQCGGCAICYNGYDKLCEAVTERR